MLVPSRSMEKSKLYSLKRFKDDKCKERSIKPYYEIIFDLVSVTGKK